MPPWWRASSLSTRDVVRAGAIAGSISGLPSTIHAVATGRDLLESTRAAGSLLLPGGAERATLTVAGGLAHSALSVGWAALLSRVLPLRPSVTRSVAAAVAGLSISALDLGVVGRRLPAIRALPLWPQVADHVMYAEMVAWILARSKHRQDPRVHIGSPSPSSSTSSAWPLSSVGGSHIDRWGVSV